MEIINTATELANFIKDQDELTESRRKEWNGVARTAIKRYLSEIARNMNKKKLGIQFRVQEFPFQHNYDSIAFGLDPVRSGIENNTQTLMGEDGKKFLLNRGTLNFQLIRNGLVSVYVSKPYVEDLESYIQGYETEHLDYAEPAEIDDHYIDARIKAFFDILRSYYTGKIEKMRPAIGFQQKQQE